MLESPQITRTEAQQTAIIRLTVPRAEIRNVMGAGLRELMSAVAAQGVGPVGPWFTHHLRPPGEIFDFEIGVPVSAPVAAAGRVTQGQLPATKVARAVYRGPYEGLAAAWGEFDTWIKLCRLNPAAELWEVYVVGPESGSDPSNFCTELNRPLLT